MQKRNDIRQLEEWQEHQYNTGYWLNRFSPDFPPKPGGVTWFIAIIEGVVFLAGIIFCLIVYFVDHNLGGLFLAGLISVFMLRELIVAIRFRPRPKPDKSQAELEEMRRMRNQAYRNKIHNKRKDSR